MTINFEDHSDQEEESFQNFLDSINLDPKHLSEIFNRDNDDNDGFPEDYLYVD